MTPSDKQFDVCIIGSGPAGLACLSAIQEPYSLDALSDNQVHRAAKHHFASCPARSVAIIDPHPAWMEGWKRQFKQLGIQYLRSPALAHPDMFDQNALLAYAETNGRQDELIESGCGDLRSLFPLGQSQIGLWKLPSLNLFVDFCTDLSQTLKHEYIQGKVLDLNREEGMKGPAAYTVCLESGIKIHSKAVILALGSVGKTIVPRSLSQAPRLINWTNLDSIDDSSSKNVLVIGGGLTAVQVAQRLVAQKNSRHQVTLCSRRPLVERHFDIAVEWFDRRTTNKCMADFYHLSHSERLSLLKASRGGGSVPGLYMKDIKRLEKGGRLRCKTGNAEYLALSDDGSMAVNINGSVEHFDAIVLACGIQPDCESNPFCCKLLKKWPIPVVGGFPSVSEDAEWTQKLFVVGGLSSLSIGPDAANLMGMRRSAQIVANALECRCWLREKNVLQNPFAIFMDDETETESESEEE